jgi:hypothetical protein
MIHIGSWHRTHHRASRSPLGFTGVVLFVALASLTACGGPASTPEPSGFEPEDDDPMEIQRHFEEPEGEYTIGSDPVVDISPSKAGRNDGDSGVTLAANVYMLSRTVARRATVDDGRVRLPLADDTSYLLNRETGDVIITPNKTVGARKILDIEIERGSHVVWETRRPKLTEVVLEGEFYYEVDLSDPSDVPHVDLAEPYFEGALQDFEPRVRYGDHGPDAPEPQLTSGRTPDPSSSLRTRQRALEKASQCEPPPTCKTQIPCGRGGCPCSSETCDGARQCATPLQDAGSMPTKYCTGIDPCKERFALDGNVSKGFGCKSNSDIGALPTSGDSHCTSTCQKHSECPNGWRCTTDNYCTKKCPDLTDASKCSITRCEIQEVACGQDECSCSSGYCSGSASGQKKAKQCASKQEKKDNELSDKSCNVDPCKHPEVSDDIDGVHKGLGGTKTSCIAAGQLDETHCTLPCNSNRDCPRGWTCTDKNYCASDCGGSGGGSGANETVGEQKREGFLEKAVSVLGTLFGAVGQISGFQPTLHPYIDIQPKVRMGFNIEWDWETFQPTFKLQFLTQADFLAGLGVKLVFTQALTLPPFEAEPQIPFTLVAVDIFGVQFYVTLNPFGKAELTIQAKGEIKIDAKLYTTRKDDDGNQIAWKDSNKADWANYKKEEYTDDKSFGAGSYSIPEDESPSDPIMGSYIPTEKKDEYGLAFGFAVGGGPAGAGVGCPYEFEESDDACTKPNNNLAFVGKAAIEDTFALNVDTSIEVDTTAAIGAELGLSLYAPSNRLFFVDPVNILATSYAAFDPPFCGFSLDLFYRLFFGIGPIGVAGFTFFDNPPLKIPVLKIPILSTGKYAQPSCYIRKDKESPIDPRSFDEWESAKWKRGGFFCKFFRLLARLDSDLACGAPAKAPEPKSTENCPPKCVDGKTCFEGQCVDDPGQGLRVSLRGGTRQANLEMKLDSPDGQSIGAESYGAGKSFKTLQSVTVDKPLPGTYSLSVVATYDAGASENLPGIPYTIEIQYGGKLQERLSGTIKRDVDRGGQSFVTHNIADVPCIDGHTISLQTSCGYQNRGVRKRVCRNGSWTKECREVWYNNCREIDEAKSNPASKVYTLDPRGNQGPDAFKTYCEMDREGGGWTLALKADGGTDAFDYSSNRWTSDSVFHPERPGFNQQQAKLDSFSHVGFQEVLVGMNDDGQWEWLSFELSKRYNSLLNAFRTNKHLSPASPPPSLSDWENLVSNADMQDNCRRQGLNASEGESNDKSRARIGHIANNEDDCEDPDSTIGIGIFGEGNSVTSKYSVGHFRSYDFDQDPVNIEAFGAVFVR